MYISLFMYGYVTFLPRLIRYQLLDGLIFKISTAF